MLNLAQNCFSLHQLFQLCFSRSAALATSWKAPVSPGGARFMSEPPDRSGDTSVLILPIRFEPSTVVRLRRLVLAPSGLTGLLNPWRAAKPMPTTRVEEIGRASCRERV